MVNNGRQAGTVRKRDSGDSPPVSLSTPPASKKRKAAQQDDSAARSEQEETQDAMTQDTGLASAALDLFSPEQEADWDALIAEALHCDAPKATLYGDSEAVLSREQLRARRLQAITRLAQIYQLEYWSLLEELRARANRAKPSPSSPAGRPTRASTYRPLRDIFEAKEASREALTATGKLDEQAAAPTPLQDTSSRQEDVVLFDDSLTHPGEDEEAAACGRGIDVLLPTYEQVEQWLLSKEESAASTGLPARAETLLRWRMAFVQRLPALLRLEQAASALASRSLDAIVLPGATPPRPFNALACLISRSHQYLMLTSAVELGRSSKTRGSVDLDLSQEADSCKLSRRSARIVLQADGRFFLYNVGRRHVRVNNAVVHPGAHIPLPHLSLVSIVNVHLLFMVNAHTATRLKERAHKLVQML